MTQLALNAAHPSSTSPPEVKGRTASGDRYPHQLVTYLAGSPAGRVILDALLDDDVTEVYVNSDRKVWKETYSTGPTFTDCLLEADFATMFLNAVATRHRVTLDRDNPAISAELPHAFFNRARLQGEIPPLVEHPAFNIRKPPPRTFTLHELVVQGVLTPTQRMVLRDGDEPVEHGHRRQHEQR